VHVYTYIKTVIQVKSNFLFLFDGDKGNVLNRYTVT